MKPQDLRKMNRNADKAAAFLGGLANPHRLRILCHLLSGEKSVSDLIEATDIPQTSMSQHLSRLKREGIVAYRRDHRTLFYFLKNTPAQDILAVLYNHYCAPKS